MSAANRVVTKQDVIDGLITIVDTYGADTTYARRLAALGVQEMPGESCRNTVPDREGHAVPACIAGVFYVDILGVDARLIPAWGAVGITVDRLPGVTFAVDAKETLAAAQFCQDHGDTWGSALDAAASYTS